MEILFRGQLNTANDAVKCNYIIYWSGKTGMELVDKWETEGKITDANYNQINRYFTLFEEHISPKSNALITIVELKRLFQGSMSLEDFHTKVLRLVKEAEYPEGDTWNRVLRDTIISGLASDKIWAKVIKEGKDVTLAWVMEIAWLEVSTQKHLNRMQELPKSTTSSTARVPRPKEDPNQDPVAAVVVMAVVAAESTLETPENPPNQLEKVGRFHYLMIYVGGVKNLDTRKVNHVRPTKAVCRGCGTKGHYEKVCLKKSTHLVDVPGSSTNSDPDYFDEHGEPVYTACTHGSCNGVKQEETSDPISNKCQLRESEEAGGRPLSYCSAEGWHWSWCKPS